MIQITEQQLEMISEALGRLVGSSHIIDEWIRIDKEEKVKNRHKLGLTTEEISTEWTNELADNEYDRQLVKKIEKELGI